MRDDEVIPTLSDQPHGQLRTSGHVQAMGIYGPPDPRDPMNRAHLRSAFYTVLPRAIRRQVFGRWRRRRVVYTHWGEAQAQRDANAA